MTTDSLADRMETAISLAFEAEGEAWSDKLSGDRLARVARDAIEPLLEAVTAERDSLAAVIEDAHSAVRQVLTKIDSYSWDNRNDVFVRSTRESAIEAFELLSQNTPAVSLAEYDAQVLEAAADRWTQGAWDWGNRVTMKMLSFGDEWAEEIAEFERITNEED